MSCLDIYIITLINNITIHNQNTLELQKKYRITTNHKRWNAMVSLSAAVHWNIFCQCGWWPVLIQYFQDSALYGSKLPPPELSETFICTVCKATNCQTHVSVSIVWVKVQIFEMMLSSPTVWPLWYFISPFCIAHSRNEGEKIHSERRTACPLIWKEISPNVRYTIRLALNTLAGCPKEILVSLPPQVSQLGPTAAIKKKRKKIEEEEQTTEELLWLVIRRSTIFIQTFEYWKEPWFIERARKASRLHMTAHEVQLEELRELDVKIKCSLGRGGGGGAHRPRYSLITIIKYIMLPNKPPFSLLSIIIAFCAIIQRTLNMVFNQPTLNLL